MAYPSFSRGSDNDCKWVALFRMRRGSTTNSFKISIFMCTWSFPLPTWFNAECCCVWYRNCVCCEVVGWFLVYSMEANFTWTLQYGKSNSNGSRSQKEQQLVHWELCISFKINDRCLHLIKLWNGFKLLFCATIYLRLK